MTEIAEKANMSAELNVTMVIFTGTIAPQGLACIFSLWSLRLLNSGCRTINSI